ncbi:MAG: restriction endonuclease [Chloroflexi bacterium]|nr:restriction endonuclease [Chloroflexota bacterium]
MEKAPLTQAQLVAAAQEFCQREHLYAKLFGVTDGKAVGTFIEHAFQAEIEGRYETRRGNSASGLDLPAVETDIKVTSLRQPQSSSPFRSARQKVYGLGYNLLLFVYEKQDLMRPRKAKLEFVSCAFIASHRTADYQTTRGILEILERSGNHDDIFAFLAERNLPADEIVLNALTDEILGTPPQLGYLTISNALQWRLQYGRVVALDQAVSGIIKIV